MDKIELSIKKQKSRKVNKEQKDTTSMLLRGRSWSVFKGCEIFSENIKGSKNFPF